MVSVAYIVVPLEEKTKKKRAKTPPPQGRRRRRRRRSPFLSLSKMPQFACAAGETEEYTVYACDTFFQPCRHRDTLC
jgi:hypothetical protein